MRDSHSYFLVTIIEHQKLVVVRPFLRIVVGNGTDWGSLLLTRSEHRLWSAFPNLGHSDVAVVAVVVDEATLDLCGVFFIVEHGVDELAHGVVNVEGVM